MIRRILVWLLLLPLAAQAKDIYHIHPLSEKEQLAMYSSILRDACNYADRDWHEWPADARGGFWGSGTTKDMNEGVRAIAGMVLSCSSLLKYSDALTESERKEYERKAVAAIRFAVETHVTGPQTCMDGKHWGNSWQSAMWTVDLSFGAWLIWDDLDAELRKDIERVLGHEADRFLGFKPPAGSFNDTKAEENGWDLTCLALAPNMFPDNPHAAAWQEKAIEYMMNTLSAPQDQDDKTLIDGRPVSEWYVGANVHPDFTLENHGFFHPGYIGCSSYFLTESAMFYTYAHRPLPQAVDHHLMDTWRMFQGLILANGESACPQGMDWELHGLPYINLFSSLARYKHDALAVYLEETYLQYMRAWQVMENGSLTVAGSQLGFTRHAICADEAAYAFVAHKIFGPAAKELTAREATAVVEGVRTNDWVQVVSQRTGDKYVSFSWTNRILGMIIPIGPGHESNPDFTAPIVGGFIGGFDLTPNAAGKPVAAGHDRIKIDNGFETSGVLLLNDGRLKQTLRLTSIGDKAAVYQDRVIAQTDVTVTRERGFPIGIENDKVTGGTRLLTSQKGGDLFTQEKPRPALAVAGSWANVDGRLGLVMAAGSGITYHQATGYARGISICEDMLYGSYSDKKKRFKAGDEVAHRVAIVFTEVSPRETAKLAKSVRIENGVLHFRLPEGGRAEVPLF